MADARGSRLRGHTILKSEGKSEGNARESKAKGALRTRRRSGTRDRHGARDTAAAHASNDRHEQATGKAQPRS